MPLLDKPRVNSLSASTVTLHDFMPRNALEFVGGPQIRPDLYTRSFACVERQKALNGDANDHVGHSALISIDPSGMLFYHTPDNTSATSWREELFELSELKGSRVLRILAMDLGAFGRGIHVLIVALDSSSEPQLIMLIRGAKDKTWTRGEMSSHNPPEPKTFVESHIGGFSTRQGLFLYASPQRGRDRCSLLLVDKDGYSQRVLLTDQSLDEAEKGNAHIIQIKGSDDPGYVYVENNVILISIAEEKPGPGRWFWLNDPKKKSLATSLRDGTGQIVPVTDGFGLCRGLLIFDGDGKALHCAMDRDGNVISETSLNVGGGPERIRELACGYSVGERPDVPDVLNVYARDERDAVWHVAWKAFDQAAGKPTHDAPEQAARDIKWQATGHHAFNLDVMSETRTTPFIFAGKTAGSVERFSQIKGGDWVSTKIAAGLRFGEATDALVHAIQISAVNVLSHPVPDTELEVRTDKTVLVEHQGEFFQLGPDRPTILKTGASGGLRLKMYAEENLEAPTVTVKHKDLPREFHYHPQDGAFRRLAGLAPDPGPNPDFAMTVERLRKENLIPADMNDEKAGKLVSCVKELAAEALRKGADAAPGNRLALRRLGAENASPISFTVSRKPDGFSVRSVTPADPEWSGVAPQNDIASLWSDLWAWVSKGWETVKEITATVVHGVATFVVTIGETVRSFVADTARRIGEGITSLFQYVSKEATGAAKKLVSFLAERLGWQDVIRVKNLTRLHTLRFLTDLETVVGHSLPNLVSARIAKAQRLLDEKLQEVIDKLDPKPQTSLQKFEADRQKLHANGAKTLLVQASIPNSAAEHKLFEPSEALRKRVRSLVDEFKSEDNKNSFRDAFEKLANLFSEGMTPDRVMELLVSALNLLRPLIRIVFKAVDVVQTAIFEFISSIIKLIRNILETPITKLGSSFDWINTFYKKLSGGQDLTMLDLGCLLFVAPGVMFHHLANGSDLMTSDVREEDVRTVLSPLPDILKEYEKTNESCPDAAADIANHQNKTPELITPALAAFTEKYGYIFMRIQAVYRFLSAWSVAYCNTFKLQRAQGINATTVLETLMVVADKISLFLTLSRIAFSAGKDILQWVEEKTAGAREIFLTLVVLLVLVMIFLVIQIFSYVSDLGVASYPISDLVSAVASYLMAIGMLVFVILRVTFFPSTSQDEKKIFNDRLALGATIVGIVQNYIQFCIPVGGLLTKTDPASGPTIQMIQTVADPVLCVADACLIGAQAF